MYCLSVLLTVTLTLVSAQKIPCYDFPGDTFLEFRPANYDNSFRAHYRLEFQTRAEEGVLVYSEGPDDYEALFISQGKLIYLLTNPSPSGVEGTTGGLYVSDAPVNNGSWFKVDLWRNWRKRDRPGRPQSLLRTGMEIRDVGKKTVEVHVDHLAHSGVFLDPVVYIGGIRDTLTHTRGAAPPQFVGRIRDIFEEKNGATFANYAVNHHTMVKRC